MLKVGTYEAKTRLSELLERVAAGERISITRHGEEVALLLPRFVPVESEGMAGRIPCAGRMEILQALEGGVGQGGDELTDHRSGTRVGEKEGCLNLYQS